jgi:hypothetical protein
LYYFGCNWNGELCPLASSSEIIRHTRDIWLFYAQWDPLFINIPMWLRVMCAIEVFVFGPLYLIVAIGMVSNSKWLPYIAHPFSGALFYSTLVYFAMEIIEYSPGNTNMTAIFLVNIPWTILPVLLSYRIFVIQNKNSQSVNPKDKNNKLS